MTEHSLQSSFFQYCELKARTNPIYSLCFAIPNGGHRHKLTAFKLKAEGVKAGVPDVFFAYPRGLFAGLFIEFKFGKNTLSRYQEDWLAKLRRAGYATVVVYSLDEAIHATESYIQLGASRL